MINVIGIGQNRENMTLGAIKAMLVMIALAVFFFSVPLFFLLL